MSSHVQVAQALLGEPGLEMPPEMKLLQALSSLGAGMGVGQMGGQIAQVLSRGVLPQLQAMGEAGSIFPEGMSFPTGNKAQAMEMMGVLPDAQKAYRTNEMLANWHARNMDWPQVLKDKWALLKHTGGS